MRLGVEAAIVEGLLVRGDVSVEDGRITEVGLAGPGTGVAVPGLVDLHIHGFGGVDFAAADADGYRRAGEALLAAGVTAFRPTFVTAPEDELVASLRGIPPLGAGPHVLGCHLEGPFLSAARLGIHPASARRDPELALLARLLAAGPVTHMTIAPELPGALEAIDVLVARGVVVSCGHTDATAAEAHAAFDRGATLVTHLFNAMRPFAHRDPGIAGAALGRESVTVELILDGVHVAEDAARVAWRAAGRRLALVTDAIAAAGAGDGHWRLGTVEVEVRDGVARRADGVLAGSVVTLLEAVRNLHALDVSLVDAVAAATSVPAAAARLPEIGVLRRGGPADVVVLDDRLELRSVLLAGRPAA